MRSMSPRRLLVLSCSCRRSWSSLRTAHPRSCVVHVAPLLVLQLVPPLLSSPLPLLLSSPVLSSPPLQFPGSSLSSSSRVLNLMPSYSEHVKDSHNNPHCYCASWQGLMYGSRMVLQSTPTVLQLREECKWELEKYLSISGKLKVSKNAQKPPSSLDWWKKHRSDFPTIAQLAKKWLGCIATSVPSERAFSTAGNTITELD
jgi:hypothetical protein